MLADKPNCLASPSNIKDGRAGRNEDQIRHGNRCTKSRTHCARCIDDDDLGATPFDPLYPCRNRTGLGLFQKVKIDGER